MSSVRAIADELGVSVATVSRALNNHPGVSEEMRKRVLQTADRTGYRPSVGRKPTNVIGLAYPNEPVRADFGAFEAVLLAGVLEGVNERKFDLTFINVNRDKNRSETYEQFFNRKGVRGVIVRPLDNSGMPEAIAADGFPMVLVADRSDDPRVNFIDSDSRRTSRQAVEHLIGLGHKRIGLAIHRVADSDHRDREAGYRTALSGAGIPLEESLIVRAEASPEGGAMMLMSLLEQETPPTAIYFTNPLSTVGALHKCLQLGIRVPKDLSIVGFDDGDIRMRTFPRFTAVCQDAQALGLEAARWLTRSLTGEANGTFREIRPTTLAVLDSTSFPPLTPVRLSERSRVVQAT
ncbi:MAG: LacI family transcriptional regulator [Phycisphaerales bacterium]|nr:LacI family DNA-binding transcriptional regulator [Planctomycetota bacterium]MCH8507704.1 LacI family transcriptional regulator [Phycisphaerales bacterium]